MSEAICDLTTKLPSTLSPQHLSTVLVIAGSDCSGGAGIEADLKTVTTHKCYGLTCITALTAQNSNGVHYVSSTPVETIDEILKAIEEDQGLNIDAVKVGLLTKESIPRVGEFISKHQSAKVVLDPVFVANNGDLLSDLDQFKDIVDLFRFVDLITPNIQESGIILSVLKGKATKFDIKSIDDIHKIAKEIGDITNCNVLVKGGHLPFDSNMELNTNLPPKYVLNVLYQPSVDSFTDFKSNYIDTQNTHGTGCTMSSSIASKLSNPECPLTDAISHSISYLNEAIRKATPRANGPLNHVFGITTGTINTSKKFTGGNLLEYLSKRPESQSSWEKYTTHEFVRQIYDRTLPLSKFNYFIKQDYRYLQSYHLVHSNLLSITKEQELRDYLSVVLLNIETEMKAHSARLKSNFYPDLTLGGADLDLEIIPGQATINYTDYMVGIFNDTKDWLLCKTSLMPCLVGYNHAIGNIIGSEDIYVPGSYASLQCDVQDEPKFVANKSGVAHSDPQVERLYGSWLADYNCGRYLSACATGDKVFDDYFRKYCEGVEDEEMDDLINKLAVIFGNTSRLEAEFWDECLNYEGN